MWWFKFKEGFKKKPAPAQPTRTMMPGMPTGPYPRQVMPMMQRPAMQPAMQARQPIRAGAKDKEMEEALRKLREMGKK